MLAALVHEAVKADRFATLADLAEAVKRRAATLRIAYDSGQIAEAMSSVARTRTLVAPPAQERSGPAPLASDPVFSRVDANRVKAFIASRVGHRVGLRTISALDLKDEPRRDEARANDIRRQAAAEVPQFVFVGHRR